MKLSKYARKLGLTYRTAWNHYQAGNIPNAYQLPSGTIIIPEEPQNIKTNDKKVCIYARVSSSNRKDQLNSQVERLEQYCNAKGWQIIKIVKDVASGINDHRPQLTNVIQNLKDYDYVVIEHKDRLTRLGFNYFQDFAPDKFHVVNPAKNETEDLTQDLVAIITSFCARLYGQRKGKRKTENILKELENDTIN
jgi:predicted site-specific integrase-resolvase